MSAAIETMPEMRRYTLFEIDAMRSSLYAIEQANMRWYFGDSYQMTYGTIGDSSFQEEQRATSMRVEDQLRTYMLGGVSPEDLAEKLTAAKAEQEKWLASERAAQIDRLLRKEYGPR